MMTQRSSALPRLAAYRRMQRHRADTKTGWSGMRIHEKTALGGVHAMHQHASAQMPSGARWRLA